MNTLDVKKMRKHCWSNAYITVSTLNKKPTIFNYLAGNQVKLFVIVYVIIFEFLGKQKDVSMCNKLREAYITSFVTSDY